MHFDEAFDVVVVGFGLGGGVAAINAAQSGAKTLLIEKSSVPGGLSICSYGAVRSARNVDDAFELLNKTIAAALEAPDVLQRLAGEICRNDQSRCRGLRAGREGRGCRGRMSTKALHTLIEQLDQAVSGEPHALPRAVESALHPLTSGTGR